METTRDARGVPAAPGPGITPRSKKQLAMTHSGETPPGEEQRTAGFRLLYNPSPRLAGEEAEIAFIVERPRSSYRFCIWTRHGCRSGEDAVSLETWQAAYLRESQTISVPAWMQEMVLSAWDDGEGSDEEICRALQKATLRLESENRKRNPTLAGEVTSR